MPESSTQNDVGMGLVAAASGYGFWGLTVIFYKLLGEVPPLEILAHRAIWSVVFVAGLMTLYRRWDHLRIAIGRPGVVRTIALSTLMIGTNWFLFIWSVGAGRVLEVSLGYYINPLISVLMGFVLLNERLSVLQKGAVGLAFIGVINQTIAVGVLPWIPLILAVTFAYYGYLRKTVAIEAMDGLFLEAAFLMVPGLALLAVLTGEGTSHFIGGGAWLSFLLLMAGPVTAIPLLLFSIGARRLPLAAIGLLQYIAPSIHFLLAVFFYGEVFTPAHGITFALIWSALALFTWDIWQHERRRRRQLAPIAATASSTEETTV